MQLKRGVRIGRPFGIPLLVHGSWLPAAMLLVLHFTLTIYAGLHPVIAAALGIVSAVVFFVCLVAHELGHAVVARALGIGVVDITLFIFGGVARIAREPSRPQQEIVIALAGPVVSVGIGATALALAGDGTGAIRLFLWTLGAANIALAAFNLLPAFPLDGGRVLRALLWARSGSLHRATLRAGRLGQSIGVLLVVVGVGAFVLARDGGVDGGGAGGLWLGVVGVFLVFLASSARRAARVAASLEEHAAGSWAKPFAGTLTMDTTMSRVAPGDDRPYAVADGGRLAGVLLPAEQGTTRATSRSVADHMIPWAPGITFPAGEPLTRALERLAVQPSGLLVIVNEAGAVVGVLDDDAVRAGFTRGAAPPAVRGVDGEA